MSPSKEKLGVTQNVPIEYDLTFFKYAYLG